MGIRFRYMARDGQEVQVATTDELVQEILSGNLREDSLLYDAQGGGWAPAIHHTVFLVAARPPSGREGGEAEARRRSGSPPHSTDLPDFRFALADATLPAADDMVARLLRERNEGGPPEPPLLDGLVRPDGDSLEAGPRTGVSLGDQLSGSDAPPGLDTDPAHVPRPVEPELGIAMALRSAHRRARPLAVATPPTPARPAQRPRRGPAASAAPRAVRALGALTAAMAAVATVLVLTVLVSDALTGPAVHGPVRAAAAEGPTAQVVAAPFRSAGVLAELAAAEALAFQDMILALDDLRGAHGVERVPSAWLEGVYLAGAGAFPEVRAYWDRYGRYVEDALRAERDLFRRSLVNRLEAEGVSDAVLSMRLGRASRAFDADEQRRAGAYASMLELAAAAVELHDLLVEHEDEISFEPARGGLSRNPVTEAVPESPELEARINRLLDRIFGAIERSDGERVTPREELPWVLSRRLATTAVSPMK